MLIIITAYYVWRVIKAYEEKHAVEVDLLFCLSSRSGQDL